MHAGKFRLILIDKNPYHLRKVLLFKSAVRDDEIRIPLTKIFPSGVEIVQATVTRIESEVKSIQCRDAGGNEVSISYYILVLALGSVVRQPDKDQGGIALASLEAAQNIREVWRTNLQKAVAEKDVNERQRLMTIAVAGAGISGIETVAELTHAVREDAAGLGLDPNAVRILLIDANERLLPEGPAKVAHKLEQLLAANGVTILHGRKVVREEEGQLALSSGQFLPVGLCVWTLGLLPNPMLRNIGLPHTPEGYVVVDGSYRVQGTKGVYSIGDCARIFDPVSGRIDRMTCKEATVQASRLGKIIAADLAGQPAPQHQALMDFFCFYLGPEQAMIWTRKWGLDLIVTGKLGVRIRQLTWNTASLL